MSSFGEKYSRQLALNPLITKAVTAAGLATFNEAIAAILAGEVTRIPFDLKLLGFADHFVEIPNPLNFKMPILALFAFFVQAPLSHYAYKALNGVKVFRKKPLSITRKVLQMVVSLATITPAICLINAVFLSALNNASSLKIGTAAQRIQSIKTVLASAKRTFPSFLKSSWISSPLILFVAQNYLDPNSWVVFFNLAYFILGTFQNTLLKKRMKKMKESKVGKEEEVKEKTEKRID